MRLTKANVGKLSLPAGVKDKIFFDDEMPGFGLRIRDGGKRTWVVQYRFGAKQRRVTLGAPATLPAEQARAEAARVLSTVTLGSDPQTEKHAARKDAAVTFGSITPHYLAAVEARQTARYHADVKRYLEVHWSLLADLPIAKISRSSVAKGLADIAKARGAHSADRARANLSGFFSWAIGAGIAAENPVVGTNRPVKIEARDRVLEDAELALVWASLGSGDFSAIVRLLTLTACRREEVAGMAHSERSGDLWTIPGTRSKNGRPHELPLPPLALSILDERPRSSGRDLVFGGGDGAFSGWSKSKTRLDEKMLATLRQTDPRAKLTPWRLHDLRRTAATRMGDLGVQPHVVEAVLNHVSGHRAGVAGIYNRAAYRDEKRAALALWADRVAKITGAEW